MRRNHNKLLKHIFILFIFISLLGCNTHNGKDGVKQDDQSNNYELKFIETDDKVEIKKLSSIEELPAATRDKFSVTSTYNHIYLYENLRENDMDRIKSVYSCDIANDVTTKLKEFEDKFVVSFIEFEDSYVYAYLEDTSLKIVQEKDGVVKNITEAKVYNRFIYTPQFFISDNQLLFLLTDTKIESDESKIHIYQSLLSYKDDKLVTLYETDFSIIDDEVDAEAKQILSSEFLIQGDGKMMFEVRGEDSITLFKYDKGELTNVTLDYPNYFLVAYLGNNAIFYDKSAEKYLLFNLETNVSTEIGYTDAMYYPKIYNSTVVFFNDRKNKLWSLSLDESNNYTLTDMDKTIFNKMNLAVTVDRSNFVFSDGNNILLTQSNPESEPFYSFYSIKYLDK